MKNNKAKITKARRARFRLKSCLSKRRYSTAAEARDPQFDIYHCEFCNGWHRTTLKIWLEKVTERFVNMMERDGKLEGHRRPPGFSVQKYSERKPIQFQRNSNE